jgi:hypothetical protein
MPRLARSFVLPAACLALLFSVGGFGQADDLPLLEHHPLADAKPGEFLRWVETGTGGWKKWYVERVLAVREGEVFLEVQQTNEEGTKDLETRHAAWTPFPREFKPSEEALQRFLKDEMVPLEVAGQTLPCRYLYIEEATNPPWPDPKQRRHVWYSNAVPATGKVKESRNNREAIAWGQMTDAELAAKLEAYERQIREADEGAGEGTGEGSG